MTSKYLSGRVQRVKSKKIIKGAIITFSPTTVSFYLDGKNFAFDYSNESIHALDKLLSFVKFRTLRIDRELFDPKNVELFEKVKNSWISSVKNVKKLYIPSIEGYEEEFLKLLSLIDNLEELEIRYPISSKQLILQILAKMKNVKSLYLSGKMDDEFLKLLASKTSPEKPLIKCRIYASFSTFTVDAEEKFKQDVYCVKKDKIKFHNDSNNTAFVHNW
uniref:Uncharacterized protein n=1 Tax=Panagrolaimus sp. JU765 TaxID=591449 RepID=A0AC34RHJ2_9BILA